MPIRNNVSAKPSTDACGPSLSVWPGPGGGIVAVEQRQRAAGTFHLCEVGEANFQIGNRLSFRALPAQVRCVAPPLSLFFRKACESSLHSRALAARDAGAAPKDWADIMAINLNGVFDLTHGFLHGFLGALGGRQ
jgi:NAD(P)-dependent dehydrogenase (short-subunit alcohol dehydrogenase family)